MNRASRTVSPARRHSPKGPPGRAPRDLEGIAEFTARPVRPALTSPTMDALTEREVLALVALGLTSEEIAMSPGSASPTAARR